VTLKAMYGAAFRAPTFVESYLDANGGADRGNKDNRPETIQTGELEADYRFGARALWRVVLFQNRINDLIQLMPMAGGGLKYMNVPAITTVKGFETEVNLTLSPSLHGYLNYSCQSGRNEATGAILTGMANWRGNAGLDWSSLGRLDLNGALNLVGQRQRAAGDPRPALGGYSVVDVAANLMLQPGLDLSLTAHNLLDADQRYPEPYGYVPGDFPGEGRNLQAGLRWKF